jgi:hypothetical protein
MLVPFAEVSITIPVVGWRVLQLGGFVWIHGTTLSATHQGDVKDELSKPILKELDELFKHVSIHHIRIIVRPKSPAAGNSTTYLCLGKRAQHSAIVCFDWIVAKQIIVPFRNSIWVQ